MAASGLFASYRQNHGRAVWFRQVHGGSALARVARDNDVSCSEAATFGVPMRFESDTATATFVHRTAAPVEWAISEAPAPYQQAVAAMEARAAAIAAGEAAERVWLLEHPPLYTAGTSAHHADLLVPDRFPVFQTGRGGEFTYHGPGQRVAYLMLDLNRRGPDLRRYVRGLETWLIAALAHFCVEGERREDRIGVWVRRPDRPPLADGRIAEDKIAAIGIRVRRWVTFHGISLNVAPELEHYSGIVPCGVSGHGVTSLADLGVAAAMPDVDRALKTEFERLFGHTISERNLPAGLT
jgi:lipoyl(octanoyl) transferase